MRRGAWLMTTGVLALALGLACMGGDDDEPSERFQGPDVETLAPLEMTVEPMLQRAGEGGTVRAELTIRWPTPDGSLPEAFQSFDITQSGTVDDGCQYNGSWIEEGTRYRFTLRAGVPGKICRTYLNLSYESATRVQVTRSPSAYVQTVRTDVDRVLLPVDAVHLAEREARPMIALPVSGTFDGDASLPERQYTSAPVTWSSTDTSVFTVDEDGVLFGVDPGEAELVAEAGGVEARVPVTVTDAALAAPGLGRHPFARWNTSVPALLSDEPADHFAAADSQGWPVFSMNHAPGGVDHPDRWSLLDGPLVVSRWTGTGFGYEALGEPGDRFSGGQPTFDPQGRLQLVVYDGVRSERWLYTRPSDTAHGGWERTLLPYARQEFGQAPDSLGVVDAPGTSGALFNVPPSAEALSVGDTTFWALGASDTRPEYCAITVRLGRVTPDGSVEVELVDQADLAGASPCSSMLSSYGLSSVDLLPPPVGSDWPIVMVTLNDGQVLAYARSDQGWQSRAVGGVFRSSPELPPTDRELEMIGVEDASGDLMIGAYHLPLGEFDTLRRAGDPDSDGLRSSAPRASTLAPGRHHHLALPARDSVDATEPTFAWTVPVRRTPQLWNDEVDGRTVAPFLPEPPGPFDITLAVGAEADDLWVSNRASVYAYAPDTLNGITTQVFTLFREAGARGGLYSGPSGIRAIGRQDGDVLLLGPGGVLLDRTPGRPEQVSTNARGDLWMILVTADSERLWARVPAGGERFILGTAERRVRLISARPDGGAVMRSASGGTVTWTWIGSDGTIEETYAAPEDEERAWLSEILVDDADRLIHASPGAGTLRLRRSEDGGRTWTVLPAPPVDLDNTEGWRLRMLDDGRLLLAGSAQPTFEVLPRPVLLTSDDGGRTWDDPVWVGPDLDLGGLRDAVVTDGGTWVLTSPYVLTWVPER